MFGGCVEHGFSHSGIVRVGDVDYGEAYGHFVSLFVFVRQGRYWDDWTGEEGKNAGSELILGFIDLICAFMSLLVQV